MDGAMEAQRLCGRIGTRGNKMIQRASRLMVAGAMAVGLAGLGGCATKEYVDAQSAVASGRLTDHEAKLEGLDKSTREALLRAEAAGKLAEGKFVYSMVLSDDSMKFQVGKATLSPEAQARLDTFAEKLMTENRNVYIEVQGHTDSTGTSELNYRLGNERADVVRRYLNQKGVPLNRIGTISYGPDAPVASNANAEGRQANRRVMLIVLN
jgi:peptidoglycan-associated lipoprotein